MVRWLVLFTLGVFIACIATGFAVIWLHGGTPEPFVIVAVAFCTALLFLLRVHVLNVLHRRREIRAVKALIDAMARLSDGDLSVYRSILKKEEGETSSILTSEGQPQPSGLGADGPPRLRRA